MHPSLGCCGLFGNVGHRLHRRLGFCLEPCIVVGACHGHARIGVGPKARNALDARAALGVAALLLFARCPIGAADDRDARGQPAEQAGFGFGLLDSGGKRERAAQIGRELVELVVGDVDSTLIVFGFLQLVDRLAKVDDGV